MKKIISLITATFVMLGAFTGCSSNTTTTTTEQTTTNNDQDKTFNVVTTIFPIYDWTSVVLGDTDNVNLSLLVDDGVDLHSYQPTVDDIITISDCDMFIYVGGESDTWVDDVLENKTNPDMVVLNLLDILGEGVKIEETVEGMQETEHDHDHEETEEDHDHEETEEDHDHEEEAEEDHDHEETEEDHDHEETEEDHDHEETEEDHDHEEAEEDHDHEETEEDHDHEEEAEADEHVWLSLKNSQLFTFVIAEQLIEMTGNTDFNANALSYVDKLATLDEEYAEVVSNASQKILLFGDRFPFRYLVDDYDITYYAAFAGCSAETEASFETIAFLSQKVDELSLTSVLTIDSSDQKIAQTIVSNTINKDQQILRLDSMQSVTSDDVNNGTTYLSVMESNLSVLEQAFN